MLQWLHSGLNFFAHLFQNTMFDGAFDIENFFFETQSFEKRLQLIVLGLVFALTYVVPVLLLLFLRNFGFIKDFQVSTIKERRFPVIFMILLLYFLGNIFGA